MVLALKAAMNESDPVRRAIKVWMREVMTMKDWSAGEWARRAGTSPTNITRFLSPTSMIMPSSATISKLARVAGSQPRFQGYGEPQADRAWQVPLVAARVLAGLPPRQLWEFVMSPSSPLHRIAIDGPVDGPVFVADVPSSGMTGRGIVPGDRLLIEKMAVRDLEPGFVVLFWHDGAVKVGEWQGSLIIFYPAAHGDVQFQPVRTSDVEVYGRVRRLIRDL